MEEKFIQFLKDNKVLTQFEENIRNPVCSFGVRLNRKIKTFCDCVKPNCYFNKGFTFFMTPEGHDFWWKVHEKWLKLIKE